MATTQRVIVVALAVALFTVNVACISPPCTCGQGTVQSRTPRCVCVCSGTYLQPDCSFQTTDTVKMQVWYDYESRNFVSELAVAQLNNDLATTSVVFVYATGSFNGKTLGVFTMDGRSAYNLRAAADLQLQWVSDAQITAVYLELTVQNAAPPSPGAQIELYRNGVIVITAEGVGYLIAAIAVLLAVCCLDNCCCGGGRNNAVAIKHDVAMGLWDPKLGKDPVLKYVPEAPPQ